jgi:hypothetical protein
MSHFRFLLALFCPMQTSLWDPKELPHTMFHRSPKTLVAAGQDSASATRGAGGTTGSGFFFGEDSSIGPQEDKRLIRVQSHEIQSFKEKAMRERDEARKRVLAPVAEPATTPDERARLIAEERAAYLKIGSADGTGARGIIGRRTISPDRLSEALQGAAGAPSPIARAGAAAMTFTGPTSILTGFGAAAAGGASPIQERSEKRHAKAAIEVAREEKGIGQLDLTGRGGPSDDAPRRGRKFVTGGIDARSSANVAGVLNSTLY